MRRFLLAALLVSMPSWAAAQRVVVSSPAAPYVGKTVAGVRLLVEERPTDDESLKELVEVQAGRPLAMADVRASITHLFSLGRFDDVQVEAAAVAGGVEIRFNLVPLHNVSRLDFRGSLGVSEGELRKRVSDRFGALPAVGRAPEVARTLEQQVYPDFGYLRARVRWQQFVQHDPDRTVLSFDVESGPQATIRTVAVEGDPLTPVPAFTQSVGAVQGGPYRPADIRKKLDDYVKQMKKKGRYEATATVVPRPSEDGSSVAVTIEVQPGPVVTVAFEGDPLPHVKLSELVPVEREGSADEDLIEDSARRITDLLHQQGYWKAQVTPNRREGDGTLTIVFAIKRGAAYRIASPGPQVTGNTAIGPEQLAPMLAHLGAGDPFVQGQLDAAVSALTGTYQRLGFSKVKVQAIVVELAPEVPGQGLVRPTITVVEGPRATVGEVKFEGNKALPPEQLQAVVKSAPAAPYYAPQAMADREAILLEYLNAGHASAEVVVFPALNADGTRQDLTFKITEGPRTIVDHIIIIGNARTDERVIQRELLLRPGQPLGLEDLIESQNRLSALGLFRRVRITALSHGTAERRDVLVAVEEAASTTLSYGGGVEGGKRLRATGPDDAAQEQFELAPRGFIDVGRRNLGGKNRSINFYSRLSLRPEDAKEGETDGGSLFGFPEFRVGATYREPRAFGTRAEFTLTGLVEQGVRTTFNFARKGVGAELAQRLSPGVRVTLRYTFGTTRTFDERLNEDDLATFDRAFPQVRLSGFGSTISRDTRDDVLDPARGTFLSGEGSFAARALGGQVGFVSTLR